MASAFTLTSPTTSLPGVGEKLAEKLSKCGIETIEQLLFHLPFRYQDRTRLTPIAWLQEKSYAVVQGMVLHSDIKPGKRRQLQVTIADKSGRMQLRFFNFNSSLIQIFTKGQQLRCFGQIRFINTKAQMVHPEFNLIDEEKPIELSETMTPIYSSTQGLTQNKLRLLIHHALQMTLDESDELLPESIRDKEHLAPLKAALHYLHAPPPDADIPSLENGEHPLQQRLALEELLAHHLSMLRLKKQAKAHQATLLTPNESLKKALLQTLPFQLTNAQQKVIADIETDLQTGTPMQRLVQGDVGSGKTIVAAIAAMTAISHHQQVALMSPTELLAEQHALSFQNWLGNWGIQVELLLGKHSKKEKAIKQARIENNDAQIIIGTHALFQETTHFKSLALVIIDEQHRFGVKQRLLLQEKGQNANFWPHLLFMTATPIPRTLAMAQLAHLDISVIDELPPGRTPVKTVAIDNNQRQKVIDRLKESLHENKQAYWICTLIEESEVLQCQTAEETAKLLEQALLPYKVGLVHGRMSAQDKLAKMTAFKEQKLDVLVATTVIEVGVDVPNSTIMVIENAERLGLFQLHQLRGRVGRGDKQSHCVLLYQSPLSYVARERLNLLRQSNDGFEIAEADLKLRGSGQILGTRQTGQINYRIANPFRDKRLLNKVQNCAKDLIDKPHICERLIKRWLGEGEKFSKS
jgi:ATP-dependent DNA helicase RecG